MFFFNGGGDDGGKVFLKRKKDDLQLRHWWIIAHPLNVIEIPLDYFYVNEDKARRYVEVWRKLQLKFCTVQSASSTKIFSTALPPDFFQAQVSAFAYYGTAWRYEGGNYFLHSQTAEKTFIFSKRNKAITMTTDLVDLSWKTVGMLCCPGPRRPGINIVATWFTVLILWWTR